MEWSDSKKWNVFIASQEHSQFLQSWEWGEFQKRCGRDVVRLCKHDGDMIISAAQLISLPLFLSAEYWYSPRGPIIASEGKEFFNEVVAYCRATGGFFFRFEPLTSEDLATARMKYPVTLSQEIQPAHSYVLDLSLSEGELLSRMREKTRYNVRLASRKEVRIVSSLACGISDAVVGEFIALTKTTADRNRFSAHPDWYYRRLFASDMRNETEDLSQVRLLYYRALYNDSALAAALVLGFGDTATYVHGASGNISRERMAPYALHWQILKDMKALGYRYYDFGGVAHPSQSDHPLAGVTHFKEGFGGTTLGYPGTFDLPFRLVPYGAYRVLRGIWRRSRIRR